MRRLLVAELVEGDVAPDFELLDDADRPVRLADLRGQPVVLYFYPKDDTPGCTAQACGFRDHLPEFDKLDALVLGVSPDPVESHKKFKAKYRLPFQLLSDPDHKVAGSYGAWGKKKLYGREYEGVLRSTFVVGADGRLVRVFRNVNPEEHWVDVRDALADAI